MYASGAGVKLPITRFIEFKLLTSTVSKNEPAKVAISPSVRTRNITDVEFVEILVWFVVALYLTV